MKNIIVLLLLTLIMGCVEDFDLKLNNSEPRLVVEGLITNKPGPYYVRLTKSKTNNITSPEESRDENVDPVTDAQVIVRDDLNNVDTLKLIDIDMTGYQYDFRYGGYFKFVHDGSGNIVDTLFLSSDLYSLNKRGYYKSSKLKGTEGQTYYLNVRWKDKEYTASAYMPSVPKIDSLGYVLKPTEIVGKDDKYVPLLYFEEPQGIRNYYLIQLNKDIPSRSRYSHTQWEFSILTDTYLEPYVNGLNVSTGYTPRGENINSKYRRGDTIYVALNSLTHEDYNYYKNLIDQFDNDGGAYKPSPATPPGNISNGALGLFRASAVSEKQTYIKYSS